MNLLSVNENSPTVLCSFHSSVQGINEGWIELRQPLKLLDLCHRSIESRAKAAVFSCDELCWRPSSLFEHDRSMSVGVTQWFTTDRAIFITLHLNEINGRISAIKLFISLSGLHNLARLFFFFWVFGARRVVTRVLLMVLNKPLLQEQSVPNELIFIETGQSGSHSRWTTTPANSGFEIGPHAASGRWHWWCFYSAEGGNVSSHMQSRRLGLFWHS